MKSCITGAGGINVDCLISACTFRSLRLSYYAQRRNAEAVQHVHHQIYPKLTFHFSSLGDFDVTQPPHVP